MFPAKSDVQGAVQQLEEVRDDAPPSLTPLEARTDEQADKISLPPSEDKGAMPEVTVADDLDDLVAADPKPVVDRALRTEPRRVFRPAQDHPSLPYHKAQLAKQPYFDYEPLVFAKEQGDLSERYDSMLNFIPGSCFEIGTGLSLLENPGASGALMDQYAGQLADFVDAVYNTDVGNQRVIHGGTEITLRALLDKKILAELSPTSDQIGRCLDPAQREEWLRGAGKDWLLQRLRLPSNSPDYEHTNMLTKIRSISAFGTIIRELMAKPENAEVIAPLLGQEPAVLRERSQEINTKIRHADFDRPETRARSERRPYVGDKPIEKGVKVEFKSAGPYGLGFGDVVVEDSFPAERDDLKQQYKADLEKYGRNGIRRQGQVIEDLSRPGILTEYAAEHMPPAFQEAGLPTLLASKKYHHGTGINRWMLKGSYPQQSQRHDMPAAGAHSGGTVDILLALNCMNRDGSIFGRPRIAKPAGLLISSFMNFGGYHSFVETFPIAQAVENDQRFTVEVTANQRKTLYRDFAKTAEAFAGGEAVPEIRKYHEAYNASQAPRERYRKSQEYLASMPKRRDVVTPVPVTESDEM